MQAKLALLFLLMLLLCYMLDHAHSIRSGTTLGLPGGQVEAKACIDEIPPLIWLQAGEEACGAHLCQHLIGAELHAPVFVAGLQQQGVNHLSLALNLSLHGPCQHIELQSVAQAALTLLLVYGTGGVGGNSKKEASALREAVPCKCVHMMVLQHAWEAA